MPHAIDSGDGFAEAASGVESSRIAMEPLATAGIFDSSGSACSMSIERAVGVAVGDEEVDVGELVGLLGADRST